jgi:Bifunctional DNA primase/polymerase, N-terminal/AAA domain
MNEMDTPASPSSNQHPHAEGGSSPPKLSLLGRSALAYATRFGYAVHPLKPGAKTPITAHGFKDASTEPDQIRSWWTQTPEANIGIATGAVSGISVLDEDVKDGAGGDVTLAALLAEQGKSLEAHVRQTTWSGGRQYFFVYSPRSRQGAGCYGKGLDGRNDGGYVVAPPSIVNGKKYEWVVKPLEGQGVTLPMPAWLLDLGERVAPTSSERRNPPGWADELMMLGVPEGQRDHEANRLIKHARETGKSEADCWARLTTFGSNCTPPFDPKTDRKIAEKIRKAYAKPPVFEPSPVPILVSPTRPTFAATSSGLVVEHGDQIEMKRISWLWPGHIPRGMPSLLSGDPDVGKGLTLMDLAARVTTGRPWPDELADTPLREPRHVIILSAEDPADTVIKPRLVAAGADDRFYSIISAVDLGEGTERGLSLETDIPRVQALAIERQSALLIIDPLNAYLGHTDTFTDNKVRFSLKPFTRMLELLNLAAISLMHLGKESDRIAIYRSLGSVGFTAAPRAGFCVAREPSDPESLRRLFLPVKINIATRPAGLVFEIEPATVPAPDGGNPIEVARVRWTGETTTITADEALGKRKESSDKLEKAVAWVEDALGSGPILASVLDDLAKAERISRRTLQEAKRTAGVGYRKVGLTGGWECYLKASEA